MQAPCPVSSNGVTGERDAFPSQHFYKASAHRRFARAGLPVRTDFAEFYRDFEWMGVQRHLKVLGIFARLWHRDGKARYLDDLPLVLRHLERAAGRYRELAPLARLLDELHEREPRVVHTF